MIDLGRWYAVSQTDPRAVSLYQRHYSARKGNRTRGITGPGETLTLLTDGARALFVWRYQHWLGGDELRWLEDGMCCGVFRNEGPYLSSDLIAEADALADERWPHRPLHYTWVAPSKIKSSNPGYCFKCAGWTTAGRSAKGLILLTRGSPTPTEEVEA